MGCLGWSSEGPGGSKRHDSAKFNANKTKRQSQISPKMSTYRLQIDRTLAQNWFGGRLGAVLEGGRGASWGVPGWSWGSSGVPERFLGQVLGGPEGSWGRGPGGSLGVLGGSWAVLGRSWCRPWPSWYLLGPSWGRPGTALGSGWGPATRLPIRKMNLARSPLGSFLELPYSRDQTNQA